MEGPRDRNRNRRAHFFEKEKAVGQSNGVTAFLGPDPPGRFFFFLKCKHPVCWYSASLVLDSFVPPLGGSTRIKNVT